MLRGLTWSRLASSRPLQLRRESAPPQWTGHTSPEPLPEHVSRGLLIKAHDAAVGEVRFSTMAPSSLSH
jgi:hypothetical protein